MKIDKFKDVYNKINMDASMDKNIKDKLLYYDPQTEGRKQKKQYIRTDYKGGIRSFFYTINKLSVVKAALPSIAFLVFMVVIVYSIKARMENDLLTSAPEQNIAPASGSEAADPAESEAADLTESVGTASVEDGANTQTEDSSEQPIDNSDNSGSEDTLSEQSIDNTDISAEKDTSAEKPTDYSDHPKKSDASQTTRDVVKAKPGDFYFASFDVITDNNVKAAIPNLVVRLHGKVDSIDPSDLTDVVLTLNGVPIENGITLTDRIVQFNWSYEDITDFYFRFDYENRDPGTYGLTGRYKGEPFIVYEKIIEEGVTDEPASSESLFQVGWGYYTDENGQPQKVSEVVFYFSGIQNAFYLSDLTELEVTLDGGKIECSFTDNAFRYLEYNGVDGGDTSFNLILKEAFTLSGTYKITGKYRGKSFTSVGIVIP